jgi:hypothetical protein
MKILIQKALTLFTGAKVHAYHTAIKGNNLVGERDAQGKHKY